MTLLEKISIGPVVADLAAAIEAGDRAKYDFFRVTGTTEPTAEIVFDEEKKRGHTGYQRAFLRFAKHFEQAVATSPGATPRLKEIAKEISQRSLLGNPEVLSILVPMSDGRFAEVDRLDSKSEPLLDPTVETMSVPVWDQATGQKVSEDSLPVRRLSINLRRYLHDGGSGYRQKVDTFLGQAKAQYDQLLSENGLTVNDLYNNPNYHHLRNFYETCLFPKVAVSVFLDDATIAALRAEDPDGFVFKTWPARHEGKTLASFEVDLKRLVEDQGYRKRFLITSQNFPKLPGTPSAVGSVQSQAVGLDRANAAEVLDAIRTLALADYWDKEEKIDRYGEGAAGSGSAGAVGTATDKNFDADVLKSPLPVLVDFWAEWCGPCVASAPTIAEVAKRYAGRVAVKKLHADDNPVTTDRFKVEGIPTLILFKNGKEIARFNRMPDNADELAAFIEKHL